jgi:hypothetical protein
MDAENAAITAVASISFFIAFPSYGFEKNGVIPRVSSYISRTHASQFALTCVIVFAIKPSGEAILMVMHHDKRTKLERTNLMRTKSVPQIIYGKESHGQN